MPEGTAARAAKSHRPAISTGDEIKKLKKHRRDVVVLMVCILILPATAAEPVRGIHPPQAASLWANDNLFAWGVVSIDAKPRSPEERAQMLEPLGFRQFAFDWQAKDVAIFEAQIEALKRHGLRIIAWSVYDVDDPTKADNGPGNPDAGLFINN